MSVARTHQKRIPKKDRKPRGPVKEKPGVQPLSVMHPSHPARTHGWGSTECNNRNRSRFA